MAGLFFWAIRLEKLIEHIWMIIGMARTCESELRDKVNALGGKHPVQLRMNLPLPKRPPTEAA
jgi:hypothetical protein